MTTPAKVVGRLEGKHTLLNIALLAMTVADMKFADSLLNCKSPSGVECAGCGKLQRKARDARMRVLDFVDKHYQKIAL